MDKQAYHYNKKKMKGKTPGTYRYLYPCDPADTPNLYIGGKAYAVIEVTEREWQILNALDEKEYNADHAYTRKFTPLLYATDEQALPPKERIKRLDKKPLFDESSDNETDISRAMKILNEQERKVYAMIHFKDMRQKDAAEQLGVTQGYISMVLEQAEEKIAEYDGDRSPDGIAWRYWKRFVKKGYMPDHVDVEIEYALFQLSADLSVFLHWFYSVSELIRFATKSYLFGNNKMETEIADYLYGKRRRKTAFYRQLRRADRHCAGAVHTIYKRDPLQKKPRIARIGQYLHYLFEHGG